MLPGPIRAWLYTNWFYAGAMAGIFLLILTPLLWSTWSPALLLIYLQLPIYMGHQVEEHYHDRFRLFFNDHVAHGRDVLTHDAVLAANIIGVWMIDLTALYLAYFVHPGFGAIAMYLAIINAIVHIVTTLVLRVYNPGFITAVFLLLPAGSLGLWMLIHRQYCNPADHAIGIAIAILVHALILLFARRRLHEIAASQIAPR